MFWGHLAVFPDGSVVKNLPANAEDVSSIPESERSPREGNGNPLQYSCQGKGLVGSSTLSCKESDSA